MPHTEYHPAQVQEGMSTALEKTLRRGHVSVQWHRPNGDPVATFTLDRPEARNAQTPQMWEALATAAENLPTGTRAVILRGAGPVFSAGLDLALLKDGGSLVSGQSTAETEEALEVYQRGVRWARQVDAVTIALVQGAAVGGGFQFALACDLIICAEDARFAMREARHGLVPDLGGTGRLVDAVGPRRALEICLSGRFVDAAEALSLGIATQVVPNDELETAGERLTDELCRLPAGVGAATARLMRASAGLDDHARYAAERSEQARLVLARHGRAE